MNTPHAINTRENHPHHAIGRRKSASVRVFIKTGSRGCESVNDRPFIEQFHTQSLVDYALSPLRYLKEHCDISDVFEIYGTAKGGGCSAQAGAMRLAIARALLEYGLSCNRYDEFRKILKPEGYLTRDSRKVERSTPGFVKARKRKQYRKR